MNLKDYISSGIIENYVLGFASPEDSGELEQMASVHPEVREAIDAYQKTLETYAQLHAVQPAAALKGRIMDVLKEAGNKNQRAPKSARRPGQPALRRWQWMAAAATLLLLVSLAVNFKYIGSYRQYHDLYTAMLQSRQQLASQNQAMETRLAQVEKNLDMLMDPSMTPVVMQGVEKHPGMIATIYWDAKTRHTWLGTSNLPAPPEGMAYQLWAIVDGKPVGIGMYDPSNNKAPLHLENVIPGKVQAFAISLEKQNGSPSPTMDQMYVMGKT